jgi:hypothetical protein
MHAPLEISGVSHRHSAILGRFAQARADHSKAVDLYEESLSPVESNWRADWNTRSLRRRLRTRIEGLRSRMGKTNYAVCGHASVDTAETGVHTAPFGSLVDKLTPRARAVAMLIAQ